MNAHSIPADSQDDRHPLSRRRFLAAAAGTAAATALASSVGRALGARADGTPSPAAPEQPAPKAKGRVVAGEGDVLKIGIIGIGGQPGACAMGRGHAMSLASLAAKGREKVQVVALCDLCQPYLEQGRSALEQAQPGVKVETYRKSADLLARDDIHGVVVATPEHCHAANAIEAILAGKDLYVEKPMCLNLDMAMGLWRVARANPDVIVQVGAQKTRLPRFHEARKLIKEGKIGVPTTSQTSYCRNVRGGEWRYGFDKNWKQGADIDWDAWCAPLGRMDWDPKLFSQWRRYRKTSTGIIGDLLVHQMTPMMMAIDQGWPVRVVATGGHLLDKEMENFDNVSLEVQFETGHTMIVTGSTCNDTGLETLIRGNKGNIFLGDRHCVMRPERAFAEEVDPIKVECPDIGDDQDAHRLGWLKSIRTREKPDSGVDLGLQVMVIVDLAARSMWEGGAFAFDPKTMTARKV
ncbi:MAG TPA: Gfo/Idh/MocA family oxidoreductase [Phycisphaerales bacterium]|nr:Gfo/Idh/MocA family oxidoreductase [Phycisphaerales bacterium]